MEPLKYEQPREIDMKNLFCSLFNCHSATGWRECPRCQLKRVKLMRQMRHRKRAVMLGLVALAEPCSSIGGEGAHPMLRRHR